MFLVHVLVPKLLLLEFLEGQLALPLAHQPSILSYCVLQMDRYQHLPFFIVPFKMTSYNIYPTIPLAPLDPQSYHLNVIQSKWQGLLKLKEIIS